MTDKTDAETRQKLWSMMKDVGFAMLTTEDGGKLRARPMINAQDEFDGTIWFFTKASSHKVDEVKQDHEVGVTYADAGKQEYVSLSGRATLVTDKSTVAAHWSEPMRTWFPKGVEDPEAALLKIDVEAAEYWDAPNSTMVHAFGYLKARLTGEPPHPGENEKIRFT